MSSELDTLTAKFFEVWKLLKSESLRGSVIVAAAIHDDILKQILISRLVPCEKDDDRLLGPMAPIGSLAARIDLAYRSGCISSKHRDSLHILRNLRNKFAHLSMPISFKDQSICGRTRNLFELNRDFIVLIWPKIRLEMFNFHEISSPSEMKEDVLEDMIELAGYRCTFEILASAVAGVQAVRHEETVSLEECSGNPD